MALPGVIPYGRTIAGFGSTPSFVTLLAQLMHLDCDAAEDHTEGDVLREWLECLAQMGDAAEKANIIKQNVVTDPPYSDEFTLPSLVPSRQIPSVECAFKYVWHCIRRGAMSEALDYLSEQQCPIQWARIVIESAVTGDIRAIKSAEEILSAAQSPAERSVFGFVAQSLDDALAYPLSDSNAATLYTDILWVITATLPSTTSLSELAAKADAVIGRVSLHNSLPRIPAEEKALLAILRCDYPSVFSHMTPVLAAAAAFIIDASRSGLTGPHSEQILHPALVEAATSSLADYIGMQGKLRPEIALQASHLPVELASAALCRLTPSTDIDAAVMALPSTHVPHFVLSIARSPLSQMISSNDLARILTMDCGSSLNQLCAALEIATHTLIEENSREILQNSEKLLMEIEQRTGPDMLNIIGDSGLKPLAEAIELWLSALHLSFQAFIENTEKFSRTILPGGAGNVQQQLTIMRIDRQRDSVCSPLITATNNMSRLIDILRSPATITAINGINIVFRMDAKTVGDCIASLLPSVYDDPEILVLKLSKKARHLMMQF